MNPILQALSAGYGAKKILSYISNSNPEIANKVESALAVGYPAESILKYVMKGAGNLIPGLKNSTSQQNSIYDQLQYSSPDDMSNAGRLALGIGTTLAGAKAFDIVTDQPTEEKQVKNIEQIENIEQKFINQKPIEDKSIFDQLIKGLPIDQLDEKQKKTLGFFKNISDQLESKGKTIKDPAFKKLKKKISSLFKGVTGIIDEELSRNYGNEQMNVQEPMMQQPQQMGPNQKMTLDILQKIASKMGL